MTIFEAELKNDTYSFKFNKSLKKEIVKILRDILRRYSTKVSSLNLQDTEAKIVIDVIDEKTGEVEVKVEGTAGAVCNLVGLVVGN